MKVVFVCYGNTCRSPMAAAIAKHLLRLSAESAGIEPPMDSATSDTVAVVRDLFKIDISSHRPKKVTPDFLATFDYIVALDSYVAACLRQDFGVTSSQLVQWEVKDPYLSVREAYERREAYEQCAKEIETNVRQFEQQLPKPERPKSRAAGAARKPQPPSLRELILTHRQDLERWEDEVSKGRVRGTTLQGIAKKAVDTFEDILRETVGAYGALAGIELFEGKSFKELALGKLVQFLRENSGDELLKDRTIVGPIINCLNSIPEKRNDLHHRPQQFAPDHETLEMNTQDLLNSVSKVLADPIFDYAASLLEGEDQALKR